MRNNYIRTAMLGMMVFGLVACATAPAKEIEAELKKYPCPENAPLTQLALVGGARLVDETRYVLVGECGGKSLNLKDAKMLKSIYIASKASNLLGINFISDQGENDYFFATDFLWNPLGDEHEYVQSYSYNNFDTPMDIKAALVPMPDGSKIKVELNSLLDVKTGEVYKYPLSITKEKQT